MADFRSRGWLEDDNRRSQYGFDDSTPLPEICHCGEVDCVNHPHEPPGQAELTASVVAQARCVLHAWDASDNVPPRLAMQLAALDDAIARLEGLPF